MSPPRCLVCRSRHNHPLYRWDRMPMAERSLPRCAIEARQRARYVMDVRRCAVCGHVFHTEFEGALAAYRTGNCLDTECGGKWREHERTLATDWIERFGLRGSKKVIEIGCGTGSFLQILRDSGCECVAFEPGPDAEQASGRGIRVYREPFHASWLAELEPDATEVIVCRHVLDHLADPLDFLEEIAVACQELSIEPLFLAEVPQVDRALAEARFTDLVYEHVSNFTRHSFVTLFERAGFDVLEVGSHYGDEVVALAARPRLSTLPREVAAASRDFRASVEAQVADARAVVRQWVADGRKVALWGATGKSAALINMFGLDAGELPLVIDSDPEKIGGYVPGTGQRVRGPGRLQHEPVDDILICATWRAADIAHEIRDEHGITGATLHVYRGRTIASAPARSV